MTKPLRIWHPFTNSRLDPAPLPVASAEGVYLHLADGRRILDAISSWWVNLHGHAHPRISDAVAEQAHKLEHVLLAGFTHEPVEELATRLRKWVPAELTHMFFSDDGSTAVEVALKLAVQHFQNLGRPDKHEIVALADGYHGDTAGAMSVSDSSPFTAPFESMRYPVHRVHSAYCHRCPVGLKRATCHIECVQESDEVLTGFGRTGKMFACDVANVVPDLMCPSTGLTGGYLAMGATLCTDRVESAFRSEDRLHTFYHGHSYTGNALTCAAANASLQVFEDEPVFDRIAAIARVNADRLADLRGMRQVADTRHIGTIGALELRADDPGYLSALRPKLYDFFLRRGVLLRPLGNVIYVIPPYVITREELHHVYDIIVEAIEALL